MAKNKKPEKPEKPVKKKRSVSNFLFMMFCLVIIGAFSILIARQISNYNGLRAEYNAIQAELARELSIYNDLQYQMAYFDSDAYIMQLARERLGWVRPNEIVFRPSP